MHKLSTAFLSLIARYQIALPPVRTHHDEDMNVVVYVNVSLHVYDYGTNLRLRELKEYLKSARRSA